MEKYIDVQKKIENKKNVRKLQSIYKNGKVYFLISELMPRPLSYVNNAILAFDIEESRIEIVYLEDSIQEPTIYNSNSCLYITLNNNLIKVGYE